MGLIRKEDLHDSLFNSLNNTNLIINGDFDINQRGKSIYGKGYTVDRWLLGSDADIELHKLDNGVRITGKSTGTWNNFLTRLEISHFKHLIGKTLTLTFKLLSPTTKVNQIWGLCHNTGNDHYYFNYGLLTDPNFYKDGPISIISKTFTLDQIYLDGYMEFGIQVTGNAGDSIDIEWAKLELGNVATPFEPRSYGEELALCQRYYEHSTFVTRGLISSDLLRLDFSVIYKQRKRVNPTLKIYGMNNEEGTIHGKIPEAINFPIDLLFNDTDGFGGIEIKDKKGQSFVSGELFEIHGWEADAEIY